MSEQKQKRIDKLLAQDEAKSLTGIERTVYIWLMWASDGAMYGGEYTDKYTGMPPSELTDSQIRSALRRLQKKGLITLSFYREEWVHHGFRFEILQLWREKHSKKRGGEHVDPA